MDRTALLLLWGTEGNREWEDGKQQTEAGYKSNLSGDNRARSRHTHCTHIVFWGLQAFQHLSLQVNDWQNSVGAEACKSNYKSRMVNQMETFRDAIFKEILADNAFFCFDGLCLWVQIMISCLTFNEKQNQNSIKTIRITVGNQIYTGSHL